METALLTFIMFGLAGLVAGTWMQVQVNRAKVAPHEIYFSRDMTRPFRVYRLHKEHFPGSVLRTVYVASLSFAVVFFIYFIYVSESTRQQLTPEQQLYEQRSR